MTRRKEHVFTFYAIILNPNLRATSTTLEVRLTSEEGNRFLDGAKLLKLQKNQGKILLDDDSVIGRLALD